MPHVPNSPEQNAAIRKDGLPRKTNNRPSTAPGGRKATDHEVDRRVEEVAHLIAVKMLSKTQIHHHMRKRYGLTHVTVDGLYILRARRLLRERSSMEPEEARDLVVGNLLDVLAKGSRGERLKAIGIMVGIYGLESPRKHELTGAAGEAIQIDAAVPAMSTERLAEVVAMLEAAVQQDEHPQEA